MRLRVAPIQIHHRKVLFIFEDILKIVFQVQNSTELHVSRLVISSLKIALTKKFDMDQLACTTRERTINSLFSPAPV